MAKTKSNAVLSPNLGLYLDRAAIAIPPRGLRDGLNFRIRDGKLNNFNLGWERFDNWTLNGPVLLIDEFLPLSQGLPKKLIFATDTDVYEYDGGNNAVLFLTPRYATGTVSVPGTTTVTGVGTNWVAAGIKIGDEIHFGNAAQRDPNATWFRITNVGGATTLTINSPAGPFGPGVYTIRRRFTGGPGTVWSTDVFVRDDNDEDTWWITNGIEPIMRWNGSDTQLESEYNGGTLVFPWTAKQLRVYNNMMTFMNLTEGGDFKPVDFANSTPGDPTNVASGLASQSKIHSGSDEILRGEPLGDNLAIYSKEHIVLAQFVGAPLIFIYRVVTNSTGLLASNAVANFSDYHEFIGRDIQYRFDGVSVQEINRQVWREILRTQDPVRIPQAYAEFDEENGELLWSVPSTIDTVPNTVGTPPSRAYVEHYLEDVGNENPTPYSAREFPFMSTGLYSNQVALTWDELTLTWADYNFRWNDQFFASAFPFHLGGMSDGKVFKFNTIQNADGAALNSFVRFSQRPTMDGRCRGLLTRVYPFMTQLTTPVNVTVHMIDFAAGPSAITDTKSYDQSLPEGGHFTTHYRRGRFYDVQIGSTGPSQPWELSGYDIDFKPGGCR